MNTLRLLHCPPSSFWHILSYVRLTIPGSSTSGVPRKLLRGGAIFAATKRSWRPFFFFCSSIDPNIRIRMPPPSSLRLSNSQRGGHLPVHLFSCLLQAVKNNIPSAKGGRAMDPWPPPRYATVINASSAANVAHVKILSSSDPIYCSHGRVTAKATRVRSSCSENGRYHSELIFHFMVFSFSLAIPCTLYSPAGLYDSRLIHELISCCRVVFSLLIPCKLATFGLHSSTRILNCVSRIRQTCGGSRVIKPDCNGIQ
jgi:hypothetical protein